MKSPLAESWDKWIESAEAKDSRNPYTLGISDPEEFLKNRLWRAYMAGAEAQTAIMKEAS